jgi:hypothetical protein
MLFVRKECLVLICLPLEKQPGEGELYMIEIHLRLASKADKGLQCRPGAKAVNIWPISEGRGG